MAVFGCLVFGMLLTNPLTFISDYPLEIQERYYRSQQKEASKAVLTKLMVGGVLYRTKTLAAGGDCCDFYICKKKSKWDTEHKRGESSC